LRIAIVQGAFRSLGNRLVSPLVVLGWMPLPEADFHSGALAGCNTILRC
jgi:hypothetical protein